MISLANSFKIYIANAPVDFRKGMDGLVAIVVNEFVLDLSRFEAASLIAFIACMDAPIGARDF